MSKGMPGRYRYPTPAIGSTRRTESGHDKSRIDTGSQAACRLEGGASSKADGAPVDSGRQEAYVEGVR